ncbi:MAG: prepilin-type N-terminal cleavage/methylation domain-containing protein [Elusimicrobia bacterium]|nr:prepilin-type N-terminal cleavage/methylation domain-containing protein [Elusimicrobiota bacterium]
MKQKGFSLMELVVVIMIVIILSLISGPIYNSFAGKASMSEGYALLGTIRTAHERFFAEKGYMLQSTHGGGQNLVFTNFDSALNVDARTNLYYTSFCAHYGWSDTAGFCAIVRARDYPGITMNYNLTTGVTVISR